MRRVVYLISHTPHVPYLIASLHTLRRYWTGEVVVGAWRESIDLVRKLEADGRLGIKAAEREPAYRGKNDQFLDKMQMVLECPPEDICLYLDADTTIHGDLTTIFDRAELFGFAATQFNDWTANSGFTRKRVRELLAFPGIPTDLIEYTTRNPHPALNGGVWAASPASPVFDKWYLWTMEARSIFIADEKVLNMLQPLYIPRKEMEVMLGGAWNCSPIERFQPKSLRDEDVVVRHYHGDSCMRPDKSRKGFDLWWSIFQQCLSLDYGGVSGWWRTVGNKWINALLAKGFEP